MDSYSDPTAATTTSLVKDPVCGMDVDSTTNEHRLDHDGHTYHFCSARCRTTFETDPEAYPATTVGTENHHAHPHDGTSPVLHEALSGSVDPSAVQEWTCPMHPEIRRAGPGACPICGMALEPVTVTADTGPNPELADMTGRFKVAVALSIPVLVLGMGRDLIPALHDAVSATTSNWVQLAFATPVVLGPGRRS
jgi:YHS domain-containing protein